MLMYPPGIVRRTPHPFPECISDFAFAGWIPVIGELQKLLARGEYKPLCPAPLFESNFLQVTKQGELVDLHNRGSLVTLGIAATSPALLLPDVMMIARPTERPQGEPLGPRGAHVQPGLELTRLIPLELVSIFLHDLGEQRLKLRLATGRVYYLQLCAPRGEERPLFARWLRLIYLLRAPSDSWASVPSWHAADLRGRSAKPPPSQRLRPIQEEEEPGALKPQLGEPPGSGSQTPSQGQLSGRQRPASPTRGQQPSTQSVGGWGSRCPTSPSIAAPVRRSPSTTQLLDGLSRSRAKVASPWTQGPVSGEPSAERNHGQLSLDIPPGSRSPAGTPSQRGSSAASRATTAPGSPERSRASVGVGRSAMGTASVGVGRSAVGTASVGVGRSAVGTASVGVGRSAVTTASAAAGPSRPASTQPSGMGREMEPGERSREPSTERSRAPLGHASPSAEQGRSRSQSQRESSAASRAAVAPGSPERSRASVGVGRSAVGTASVGVGRSAVGTASVGVGRSVVGTASVGVGRSAVGTASVGMGRSAVTTASAAAGPSRPASTQPSGMGREIEPGERSREPSTERSRAPLGHASPSAEQGRSRSQSQRESSAASRAAVAPGSPERSRASVGVGRSAVGTASVGVGCSAVGTASVGVGRSAVGTASVGVGRSAVTTVSAAAGPSRPASSQPSGMGREMELGERSREPSTERSRAPLGHASPSAEQGRSRSQSQRESSAASRAAVAPGSPERSRASVGVGRSAVGTASMGVGRSAVGTASVGVGRSAIATVSAAAGPSRPPSARPSGMGREIEPGERSREPNTERSRAPLGHASPSTEQGRSRSQSQRESSAALGPTGATVTPSSHERPSGSRALSSPQPASSPIAAAAPLERSQLSAGVGPSEVTTPALAVGPSGQRSRSSSRLDRAKRQGTRSRATVGESSKGKARSSSRSAGQKKPSKEKRLESKGKLKSALSSARHRSSLTFVTIYSALSNSLDKLTGGKLRQRRSQEDAKTQLSSKPSKRVTISGVVQLSGQGSQETSSVPPSAMESSGEQGPAGSGAAPQRESGPLPKVQSGGSRAATVPSSPERSRASVGVGRSAVGTASVGVGRSAVGTASVGVGRSAVGTASVGVGRSAVGTASVGVGRSALATASAAAGPSKPASTQPSGMGREMEPGERSREPSTERSRAPLGHASPSAEQGRSRSQSPRGRPSQLGSSAVSRDSGAAGPSERSRASVAAGPSERSRASVAAGPSERSRASVAAGPSERSRASVAAGPSERSRASVAAGPSEMATVSVAVGPSELGPWSSARPSRKDQLSLPGRGSRERSKTGNQSGSRISSPSSIREAGTPGTVAALGMEGDDVSRETSKKSRASVVPSSPERSRPISPGSAEKSRASVAPGSAEKSRASVAPGSAEKSRASVAPGSAEKSRASVAPGSVGRSRASVAPGSAERSRVSVAAGPSERSRASVAAGPSELATVSVAVGRSEPGSLSSARTPGTGAQRAPHTGKSPCSGAPLGTEAGDASPGSASLGRSGEQSRSQAREEGGARSQSPSRQAPHARAADSVTLAPSKDQGPSSTRPLELDRQRELGWGSSKTRSRSKGRQEEKRHPSVGHPTSRGGSEQAAVRMKSQ
ncbi:mucin-19-like isoform X3 [Mauremys reevesii]|uniref:mucin-19-like isoform X3 n=1 Tax=Mauremys reevesii TaxID=260615 RepID=UPI00193F3CF0|nr:mucin-19-like isoform X3 [Mauremys reevesii]